MQLNCLVKLKHGLKSEAPFGVSFLLEEMPMIEMDEDEMLSSDFSDDTLRMILDWLGPQVKDSLLLPREAIEHVDHRDIGVRVGTQRVINL